MRYLCLIYGDSEVFDALSTAEADALVDEHLAYDETLRERGHWVTAEAMQGPETAKIVRMRDGTSPRPTARSPRPRSRSAGSS